MIWPAASTLDDWAVQAARKTLRDDGHAWIGFAPAVLPAVRTAIQRLRDIESPEIMVSGAEIEKHWVSPDGVSIHFRVDRVDEIEGHRCFTDFKLGRPPSTHKTEKARLGRIKDLVREGRLLQGPLYAASAPEICGRYIHLSKGDSLPERIFSFDGDNPEVQDAFLSAIRELSHARHGGVAFPKLQFSHRGGGSSSCGYCRVRETGMSVSTEYQQRLIQQLVNQDAEGAVDPRFELWWRGQESERGNE